MERYGAYKDSGVEWIGEVPASWVVQRFRWTLERVNRPPLDDDEIITCFRDGEVTLRSNRREDGFTMSDKEIGYQHICAGDFVIHGMDGFAGAMGISDSDGKASPVLMVFRQVGNHDLRYINYLLRLYAWRNVFLSLSTSIRVRSCDLNWAKVAPLPMVLPNYKEQRAIADYLDAKTAEVDSLVADCEREVGLLREYRKAVVSEAVTKGLDPDAPMKDSGVEWIGEIPEGWRTSKLRFCGTTQNGISKGGEYFGSGYPFVSYGNAYRDELGKPELFGLIESTEEERERYSIMRGDILFTRTSETIEEVGIASGALEDIANCCFAGFLIRFRPNSKWSLLPEYAAYYFRSDLYRPYITKEMVLVTRASMSQQLLGGITVPIPPETVQKDIVSYLDNMTVEIDSLIEAKQSMADKLREYRKSLISEAVTGKFKVPGVR